MMKESSFSVRNNKDEDKSQAINVTVTYDFGALSQEEILEWACRGIDIALQGKLRSGSIPISDVNGKTWEVPKPGDRKRLSETDKVRKMVATLLGKKPEDVSDSEVLATIQRVMGK